MKRACVGTLILMVRAKRHVILIEIFFFTIWIATSINMKTIFIAIGADHRGYVLKQTLISYCIRFNDTQIEWIDVGAFNADRSDYPLFAIKAVEAMKSGQATHAVLLCGSGNGMAITANRYVGIYACVAWNKELARLSKEDDNCNILVLPADFINEHDANAMVKAWLQAEFKNGRYLHRIDLIDSI